MAHRCCVHRRSLAVLAAALVVAPGCIQRTISITSEPSGALVHLNDEEVGRTPLTVPFTFYGVYDVRLQLEGHQTLNTSHKAEAPWWETPGPDLVAEMLPGANTINLEWHFDLEPSAEPDAAALLDRARQLQAELEGPSTDAEPTDAQPPADAAAQPETAPEAAPPTDAPSIDPAPATP